MFKRTQEHSTNCTLHLNSKDAGLTNNLRGTPYSKTQTNSHNRKPVSKPVTKHIGNKKVRLGNYKFRRKPSRRKIEKGFININIAALNCRSISNKALFIREILKGQNLDLAFCSELNIRHKVPGFQGYKLFLRKSERKFHGIACYVKNSIHEHFL